MDKFFTNFGSKDAKTKKEWVDHYIKYAGMAQEKAEETFNAFVRQKLLIKETSPLMARIKN